MFSGKLMIKYILHHEQCGYALQIPSPDKEGSNLVVTNII